MTSFEAAGRARESAASRGDRFAFILHPLTVDYLARHPRYRWTRHLPRRIVELSAAYMPAQCVGTVLGGRSRATGKPVDGLIYALGATPRQMLTRPPEFTYTRLNAAIVHQMDFAEVRDRLPEGMGADAWHALRPNLSHVAEAKVWWQLVTGPIEQPAFSVEDRAYLVAAVQALDFCAEDPWHALTSALKEATGRKGKALFLPLRQALTGMDHGPDMKELLPLIGEAEARARLERAAGSVDIG